MSTTLRLSSMVKPFTALAVLDALERQLLDLDSEVAGQIDGIAVPPGPTVRDLLMHTGGVRRRGFFHVGPEDDVPSVRDFYRDVSIEIGFPPGTAFEYSNHGYAVLGELVAERAGMPPASGGWTTVEDLVKLPSAVISGSLPWRAETAALLTTNQARPGLTPRAIGFSLDDLDGDVVASDTGGWPGYSGTVGFCAAREVAFAVRVNMSIDARSDVGSTIVHALTR